MCRVCHTELNGNWSPFRKRQKSNICKTCDSIQRKSRQNYPVELEQKRERYAYARSLGFPCKVAARIDYKSKEAIREIAEVQGLLN
ncbi:MAG: hypothetical protein MUP17_09955 [candidate division Zixibacteria bacterium]|nr:hypothetical protein [candidate division Zixibacteria bacterium]